MKSQVAVEYLIIVSVAFMILIPTILYLNQTFTGYNDDNKLSKASETVKKIGQTADWVYSQGPPAKQTIEIFIPKDLEEISLNNKTVLFKVRTSAGVSDVFYESVAPLNGTLPSNSGYYFISLTAFQNYVNISVV
jgi:uncharacterized protein (UPF0333 family)